MLEKVDAILVPGGFGDRGTEGKIATVKFARENKVPYLGICLGYQILFDASEESPEAHGLAHWRGKVVRFPERGDLKVPHMGWNSLEFCGRDPIFDGLPDPAFVYFVHSYYPAPSDDSLVTAQSTHGIPFASACRRGRVRGVQFHPEKSQAAGLRMLENFVNELRKPNN